MIVVNIVIIAAACSTDSSDTFFGNDEQATVLGTNWASDNLTSSASLTVNLHYQL